MRGQDLKSAGYHQGGGESESAIGFERECCPYDASKEGDSNQTQGSAHVLPFREREPDDSCRQDGKKGTAGDRHDGIHPQRACEHHEQNGPPPPTDGCEPPKRQEAQREREATS